MNPKSFKIYDIYANLIIFGFTHTIVDATCIAMTYYYCLTNDNRIDNFLFIIMAYNLISFGFQPLIGYLIDFYESPQIASIMGCMIIALSAINVTVMPLISICASGIGNAIFHTGAGAICLNLKPFQSAPIGIFVAPGALGVYLGALSGKTNNFIGWQFALLLFFSCIAITFLKMPNIDYNRRIIFNDNDPLFIFLILILFTITLRSLTACYISFPWKSNPLLVFILTLAIVSGKGIGGILADEFGWKKITVSSLIISALLITFFSNYPLASIFGMFLFNFSMPVTLKAISNILPGKPSFAFGLTCLALIIGWLPSYLFFIKVFKSQTLVFILIIFSAISIFYGLKRYEHFNIKTSHFEN